MTVTLTQDETWLTAANLSHTVTFNAGEAEKGLTIPAADFSLAPTAKGDLTATVSGVGVDGDSVDVEVISIDHEPVTIAFDKNAYSFPEGGAAEEVDISLTATVDAAFPRPPAEDFSVIGGLVPGTATVSEDFVSFSSVAMSFKPSDFTANADEQQVARILFGPSAGNPLVIVDNDAYEGDETFGVQISLPSALGGLVRVKKADGTFCTDGCSNIPYPVTITDEDDLPELALAASPESIAEEDDTFTTGTVENVSTVTASITNSKTFATDQVLTLAFDDGGATYGTHYTVTLADGDANEAGHQVTLAAGQDSVSVTVTATANDTADGDRDITIAGALGGESFGSPVTITLRDDDPPNTPATGVPTIRGTAQVGQTLSASTDGITDPDGKPANASDYTYQWQSVDEDGTSNETDIGTDSSTYTAVAADVGKRIRVKVSFTDDVGNSEGPLTSAATAVVAATSGLEEEEPGIRLEAARLTQMGSEMRSAEVVLCLSPGVEIPFESNVVIETRWRWYWGNLADAYRPWETIGHGNGYAQCDDGTVKHTASGLFRGQPYTFQMRIRQGDIELATSPELEISAPNNDQNPLDTTLGCRERQGHGAFDVILQFTDPVTKLSLFVAEWVDGLAKDDFEVVHGRVDSIEPTAAGTYRVWVVPDTPEVEGRDVTVTLPAASVQGVGTGVTNGKSNYTRDNPEAKCSRQTAARSSEAHVRTEEPLELTDLALTAGIYSSPVEHDGSSPFQLRVAFSQPIHAKSADMKQHAYGIEGGEIMVTGRVKNDSALWNVKIRPHGTGPVRLALGPTTDCASPGAVCTLEGVPLTAGFAHMVLGPPALRVADAEVREGPDAALAFRVTLDRAPSSPVTVDYATSDGTAAAGADYAARSGTLVFAPGETAKTVSVPVLDDAHDEGSETLTFMLSNATGAHIADGEATGTIVNSDPLQQAWLARFGRTAAGHVLDGVAQRMKAPRAAGFSATLGGQALPGMDLSGGGAPARSAPATPTEAEAEAEVREAEVRARALSDRLNGETRDDGDEARRIGSRTVTGRELVLGSSFSLTGETPDGGTAGFWGRAAVSGFDGREGELTLDGEVSTGLLGADYARGRWLAGLIASHSRGEGSYRGSGEGTVSSTVTGLYPWGRYAVSERVSAWGAAGYGAGTLTVDPEGEGAGKEAMRAGLSLALAAAGARGELLEAPGDAGGPGLAVVSDAMFVRTESESSKGEGGNLAAAEADVTRLRLALDGSWRFALEGGAALTPSLEVGGRHDGGDAETGFGVDVGGGLAFAAPRRGLAFDVTARTLVAHEASGFRERGLGAALTFDPRPSSDRGVALSLRQTLGVASTGGADALMGRETLTGLGANDTGGARRLELTAGYGTAMFGGRFTGTPEVGVGLSDMGRDYRLGWRLALGAVGGTSFELSLEARRREPANDNEAEHTAGFRLTARY